MTPNGEKYHLKTNFLKDNTDAYPSIEYGKQQTIIS